MQPTEPLRLVYCDDDGNIYDHPELLAAGVAGPGIVPLPVGQLIPVPQGSDFMVLPGRNPVGIEPDTGEPVEWEEEGIAACSVFLAPAWTRSHLPAYGVQEDAPMLPLYGYAAVGHADGRYWTTGARVDKDVRQDPWTFDEDEIRRSAFALLGEHPENGVLQQLSRCAVEYCCRAAQNFFLARHEAPLPASTACNAQCIGCISLQPDAEISPSQERITRRVEAGDLVATAMLHWENVPDGVVSFGQGCEGEPLLAGPTLLQAVKEMRRLHSRGTINLNTNASMPELVAELAEAGLDTMRVSLNSPRPDIYEAYYQPRRYTFADVEQSIKEMKSRGRHVSLNLLYFPGVTDTEAELAAFVDFARRTEVDVVQVRNLNLDPEVYVKSLPAEALQPGFGVVEFMRRVSAELPGLTYAYFNPTKEQFVELSA